MQDKEYELTNAFKMFAYNTLPLNSKYLSLIKDNIQSQINTISLLTNRLEGKSWILRRMNTCNTTVIQNSN